MTERGENTCITELKSIKLLRACVIHGRDLDIPKAREMDIHGLGIERDNIERKD